ncbi:MAG: hypothetical protein HZB26_04510 [Candidatus Hydrogenedentes bacterium]|nr:hypothetical protein [Candidatus Hydrogenedentota bacterium]
MRKLTVLLSLTLAAGVYAMAEQSAPSPSPAAPAPAPGAGVAAQTVITDLEALQKRNAASPDEPIYEYDIESRVNADPKTATLRQQVSAFELKYTMAQDKYADGSPLLRKAQDELEAVKKHLVEAQRGVREQIVTSTLARARENSALAGKEGVQAYAVEDMVSADPRVAEIQAQIAPVETKYQQMKATYVEGAPQLKVLQQKLDVLTKRLDQVKETVRKEVLANPRAAQGSGGGVGAVDGGAALPAAAPAAAPAQPREEAALNMPLTLDLRAAHLQDITDQLGQSLGISFVIDSRVVAPKGAAAKTQDKDAKGGSDGIVTDGMAPAVNVNGKPLREALRSILDPLGLDFTVQPGFIWISTPSHVHHETFEILETRQYALDAKVNPAALNANSDLAAPPSGALDLVDVLRKAIPDVVSRESGETVSRMDYDAAGRRLTVHTTPANHRKVQSLLEALNVISSVKSTVN